MFQYANNIHCYNAGYTAKENLYQISIQTNVGKQSISFMAKVIWKDLPTHLKNSSMSEFPKNLYAIYNCIVRTTINKINCFLADEAT